MIVDALYFGTQPTDLPCHSWNLKILLYVLLVLKIFFWELVVDQMIFGCCLVDLR